MTISGATAQPKALAPARAFPMPVKDFLAGDYLALGDVVLTRRLKPLGQLVAWATGGLFGHAALIALIPRRQDGFDNSFILEAELNGVQLRRTDSYFDDKAPGHIYAIKRLQAGWFSEDMARNVRGQAMDTVLAPYDWWRLIDIAIGIVRTKLGLAVRQTDGRPAHWNALPRHLMCSGMVQYAFMKTVTKNPPGGNAATYQADVNFLQNCPHPDREQLLSAAPEDLALTPRLAWKYAVTRGIVHEVHSYDEVKALLR